MIEAWRAAGAVSSAALAFLLVVAGTLKLADPRPATGSLRRVSSTLSRQPAGRLELTARAIGFAEVGAAVLSTTPKGVVLVIGSAGVVALCTGFLWFTNLARRRGAACGCWGSLSDGPVGAHEVVQRGALLAVSIVALAAAAVTEQPLPMGVAATVLAAGCCGGLALATRYRSSALLGAATMGVAIPVGAQRAVRRSVRRTTLDTVRDDGRVRALLAAMPQTRFDWRRARVTSSRRRRQAAGNRLVAIPGTSGGLRVVAGPAGVLVAIGESAEAIYTTTGDQVTVAMKRNARESPAYH